MRFQELKQHLKQKKLLPCYLAAGEDEYLVQLAKEQFLGLITNLKELNISILPDSAPAADVVQAAEVLPAMSDLRVVIAHAKCAADLSKYLAAPSPFSVILLIAHSKDTIKPVKGIEVIDCARLSEELLSAYIGAECRKNNCTIEASAASILIEYCTRFMGRITVETAKLCAFKQGSVITAQDVASMVSPDLEYKVYELSDFVMRRDIPRALTILNDMLSESGAAGKVFGLLYGHFRRLMYVSLSPNDPGLADKLGVKDFAVSIAKRQAAALSKIRLKNLLDKLHSIDAGIKSGKINDKIALQSFVMEAGV